MGRETLWIAVGLCILLLCSTGSLLYQNQKLKKLIETLKEYRDREKVTLLQEVRQEQELKEQERKEQELKEQDLKEQKLKEQDLKEQVLKEQKFQQQKLHDQELQELILQDQILQNQLNHEKAETLQEICDYTFETEYMDVYTIHIPTKEVMMYYANGNNVGGFPIIDYENQIEKSYRFIYPEDLERYKEHTRIDSMIKVMEEHDGVNECTYRYQLYKEMRWARIKSVYLPKNRNKILVLTKDISNEQVKEINAKILLENALKDANQAVQAKQDFLSNMSHEIRTPLSGMKGMLSILLEQPEYKDNCYLKKAFISAKHLSGLLDDILDMAKIDSQTIKIHSEFMLIEQLSQYIDAIIRPMAQEKNITLQNHYDYPYDGIYIDAGRLNQIIINLLSNAVKYTNESGRITFEIRAKQIKDHQLRVCYVIEDSGIGMSEEFLNRAFLAFEQENHNYGAMGTGLGLAITKRLVELMGGTIEIESKLGVGTKVTVIIDSKAANLVELPMEARTALQQVEVKEHKKFQGKRALVVEDNEINMDIIELMLQSFGFLVEKAYHGQEALLLFDNSKPNYYDIIFMDIMMPIMDGLKASKMIRSMPRQDAKSIAIVAMTANAFLEDVNKSIESGMDYHLIKPFDKTKLLRILFQVMK